PIYHLKKKRAVDSTSINANIHQICLACQRSCKWFGISVKSPVHQGLSQTTSKVKSDIKHPKQTDDPRHNEGQSDSDQRQRPVPIFHMYHVKQKGNRLHG